MAQEDFGNTARNLNSEEATQTTPTNTIPATGANVTPALRRPRGFASMDPEKQREIARKGGRAAHMKGTAHEFTPEEARLAGRKGGEAVSRDRAHMAQIGREGGQARGARASQRSQLRIAEEQTPGSLNETTSHLGATGGDLSGQGGGRF